MSVQRTIPCVVACRDASGVPAFFPCTVTVTPEGEDAGDHYELARELAADEGYEDSDGAPVFDENDGPAFLFDNLFPASR